MTDEILADEIHLHISISSILLHVSLAKAKDFRSLSKESTEIVDLLLLFFLFKRWVQEIPFQNMISLDFII